MHLRYVKSALILGLGAGLVHAQASTNAFTISLDKAVSIEWVSMTGTHYIVRSTDSLENPTWRGHWPMVIGDGTDMAVSIPKDSKAAFYHVGVVTNSYCNEGHPAVGHWHGGAFGDDYYFLPDGTVTGSVYQNTIVGTWLPLSSDEIVFALYNRATGGGAHPSGPYLRNPIRGQMVGTTNMTVTPKDTSPYMEYFTLVPDTSE